MFFFLSKIFFFLLQPINWLLACLAYALFGRKPKWKRRSLRVGLFLALFLTNPYCINQVLRAWEYEGSAPEQLSGTFDVVIVLGGYVDMDARPNYFLNLTHAGERLTTALSLYKQGFAKKILLSGGSGAIWKQEKPEAEYVYRFLRGQGVPEADILLEIRSRNTHENAHFTKAILDKETSGNGRCLLVTSAFHMRRALGCFDKAGLHATPISTDFMATELQPSPEFFISPSPFALTQWQVLVKEWLGYFAYWMKGYL
jgi:uncharacterized SAM-binding protein YcdF (DUF218 family)